MIETTTFKRVATGNGEDLVWLCFLPWRVSFKEAEKIGLIPKRGRVLVYEIPDNLINPNPFMAKNLLKKVFKDITSLNLKNFNVLAYSAGAYFGFFVANHLKAKKMVAVAPGSELGNFYDSIATSKIKQKAIQLGYKNSSEYNNCLKETNPIANLKNLPDDIEIHLPSHDFYIPTKFGEELIYQLQKHKNPKIVRYKNKGHILTLIKFGQNNPF